MADGIEEVAESVSGPSVGNPSAAEAPSKKYRLDSLLPGLFPSSVGNIPLPLCSTFSFNALKKELKKKKKKKKKKEEENRLKEEEKKNKVYVHYYENRLKVLASLKAAGGNPYPHKFQVSMTITEYIQAIQSYKRWESP
ncbi:hypothetical protein GW17_00047131 [Ensete ventricosum]|nr:hypothetical protein GW17_00047131 [Ensete ventricosum]